MKLCPKCNRQNFSDSWLCQCGYEFDGTEPMLPPAPAKPQSPYLKRFFRLSAVLICGCILLFICENLFLFSIHKVTLGMPSQTVKNLLGKPFSIGWPIHPPSDPKKWEDARESIWVYKIDFCGLLIGTYQMRFEQAALVRADLYLRFVQITAGTKIAPHS